MEHWLGRLLSRKGIEDIIDAYRPDYERKPWSTQGQSIDDIMESIIVHKLKAVDGKRFFDSPEGEGRYIFGFAADGFDPFHMKVAHQSAHATGLWMVLYNFPPHLRYLPENMYLVGVIPGPRTPSVIRGQFGPTLKLVVDDVTKFEGGVRFSRTYKYRWGQVCKTACVIVLADALALREIGGFPSATSQFPCTTCLLPLQDLRNLDREHWPRRELLPHLEKAVDWKNARTPAEQDRLFEANKIRWSELNRLTNFNIVLSSPAEYYHLFFLNALQVHCRETWGIDLANDGGDGTPATDMIVDDSEPEGDDTVQYKTRQKRQSSRRRRSPSC
ncbi:hypothetical protein D9758_017676 [Tetrapyrgos nigripes]|uniref:Transposase n=1 Tax=Tetrapyrgos nigripes TaxID=182062 RepID=A0A8H5BRF1_9AGAR|nr:hypothetical protein D9758_017676 [Tetrapyrgos nigripes]